MEPRDNEEARDSIQCFVVFWFELVLFSNALLRGNFPIMLIVSEIISSIEEIDADLININLFIAKVYTA